MKTQIILFVLLTVFICYPKNIHGTQIGVARLSILSAIQQYDSQRAKWPITDTLFVTSLFAATNDDTICLLSFDIMELMRTEAEQIQKNVGFALNIKPDNVTVYCTHTHSSCAVDGFDLDLLSQLASKAALLACSKKMKVDQVEFLRLNTGKNFNINRRSSGGNLGTWCLMQSKGCFDNGMDVDGTEWVKQKMLSYGADSACIDLIKGPFTASRINDPFCDLILFPGKNDFYAAGIVKFTAHPVVCSSSYWKHQLGRDYPGKLCDFLQERFDCPVMFILGPSGDHRPRHQRLGIAERDRIASGLANELIKNYSRRKMYAMNSIFQNICKISIPLRDDFPISISDAQEKFEGVEIELRQLKSEERSLLRRKILTEYKHYFAHVIDLYNGYPYLTNNEIENRSAEFVISSIEFGPVKIINFHGELFHSVVQKLQHQFSDDPVILASYANGVYGYLMPEIDFEEMGYEWTWSLFDPKKIELLQNYAFELIDKNQ